MEKWMLDSSEQSVQSAIDAQVIQTALERNNTSITDAGFQSFLTNAPIPRLYVEGTAQVIAGAGALTDVVLTRIYDPYGMYPPATTTVLQIPIDGFYSFSVNLQTTFVATAAVQQYGLFAIVVTSKTYAAGTVLAANEQVDPVHGGAAIIYMSISFHRFFNAGDTFKMQFLQNTGGNCTLVAGTTNVGGAWTAPYKQYQGGN